MVSVWFHRNCEAVGPLWWVNDFIKTGGPSWWVDDFIKTVRMWGHYSESMISSKQWGCRVIIMSRWFHRNCEAMGPLWWVNDFSSKLWGCGAIMVSQWFHWNYDAVGPLWWVNDFIETVRMWCDHDDSLIIALKSQWFIKSFYNFRLNTELSQKMFLMIYFGVRIYPFSCFKGVVSSHSPQNIVTKLDCPIGEHIVMFPGESQSHITYNFSCFLCIIFSLNFNGQLLIWLI